MVVTYFKRFRMEYGLEQPVFEVAPLPAGYALVPWKRSILGAHAAAKHLSFQNELDSGVFPCLGDTDGCFRLMKEITGRSGFVPEATWLIEFSNPDTQSVDNCGTVQGICETSSVGSIQNLGVVPEHRGRGLGQILLRQALLGFQKTGMQRVTLEVTAENTGALRLYTKVGFKIYRTVFKSTEVNAI